MKSQDAVRQLKEIAAEVTEMSAEKAEKIWPWVNGLADVTGAIRAGRSLKPYGETGPQIALDALGALEMLINDCEDGSPSSRDWREANEALTTLRGRLGVGEETSSSEGF